MKNIPLPVFFVLLVFMGIAWWLNGYLQAFIKPRSSLGRLFLYLLSGLLLVFAGVYASVRLILWVFPPRLQ
ncbi:MAG: hypothetical protein ABIU63_17900 [Chitinophagaceae bacterium]